MLAPFSFFFLFLHRADIIATATMDFNDDSSSQNSTTSTATPSQHAFEKRAADVKAPKR
jgi:hypothetical protein